MIFCQVIINKGMFEVAVYLPIVCMCFDVLVLTDKGIF